MSAELHIHPLLASGRLAPHVSLIEHASTEVFDLARHRIELKAVDLVIRDAPDLAIPETGVGGFTPDSHTVFLSIDPDSPFVDQLETHVRTAVAHELHRAARWVNPGYGSTLFEAAVTEGLADHFACDLLRTPRPPWATPTGDRLEDLIRLASGVINTKTYGHSHWFYGADVSRIPRWAGYAIGWRIVDEWKSQNPDVTAGGAANASPSAFRAAWNSISRAAS